MRPGAVLRPPPPSGFSRIAQKRRRAASPSFAQPFSESFCTQNFMPVPCLVAALCKENQLLRLSSRPGAGVL